MKQAACGASMIVLVVSLAGCTLPAVNDAAPTTTEGDGFRRGVIALELGHYEAARRELARVYEDDPGHPLGRRALVLLTAMELDPRNPARRPEVGLRFAAEHLTRPGEPQWPEPVLATLYLLGLELGAEPAPQPEPEPGISPGAWPRLLPTLPNTPLATRLAAAEAEVERLGAEVERLETEREEQERELQRIRRILQQ